MTELITREQAKFLGRSRYFTGKPCKRGHVAERFVAGRTCVECKRETQPSNYEALKQYRDKDYYERQKVHQRNYRLTDNGRANRRTLAAHYRAMKLQRTPSWANREAINDFYRNCPEGYEVDHIIPLQGENVSGLHIAENLQYLTKSENCSKGNRF